MLSVPSIPVVLACPSCSMFNLFRFQFRNPDDAQWGMLIVLGAVAVPVILYAVGFRLGEKRTVTRKAIWGYAGLFYLGWFVMGLAGFHSPNLGAFLMHWLYFPLVLQWNVFMEFAWFFPPLLILSGLAIPALCCVYISKRLLGMDRRIVWKRRPHPVVLQPAEGADGVPTPSVSA